MNHAERQRIIEKVKKLYALAGGTDSPEEAESAVLMAQAILHEYNLTLTEADLQEEEIKKCFEHTQDTGTQFHSEWIVFLANSIATSFDCKILFGKRYEGHKKIPYVRFIGVEPDVSLALHTFYYLSSVALRHKNKKTNYTQRNHWRIGFAHAVGIRIVENAKRKQEETPQTSTLVVCKNDIISGYMNENFTNIKTSKIRETNVTPDAYISGYGFGEKVPLSTPVGAGKSSVVVQT